MHPSTERFMRLSKYTAISTLIGAISTVKYCYRTYDPSY